MRKIKIQVENMVQSTFIQNKLFDSGCKWKSDMSSETRSTVKKTKHPYLFVNGDGYITSSSRKPVFDKSYYEEMKPLQSKQIEFLFRVIHLDGFEGYTKMLDSILEHSLYRVTNQGLLNGLIKKEKELNK